MKQYLRFIVIWAINFGVIFFANQFFPSNYVLGNAVAIPVYSAIFAGFLLTVFDKGMNPAIKSLIVKDRGRYVMFGIHWLVNFVGLWIIARIPFFSGFGVSAFYYAIGLAFVTSTAQWLGRQLFKAVKIQ